MAEPGGGRAGAGGPRGRGAPGAPGARGGAPGGVGGGWVGGPPLDLQCRVSDAPPHGLGCPQGGWFLADFEVPGRWVVELLPLSRAVCCTLAPPAAPAQPNATSPGELLAVGCEPAVSAGSGRPMMCPAGMLATGFEGARFLDEHLVKSEYYPTGGTMCCRVGLSGGAGAPHVRVVEPCNCERRGMQDVGCGVHLGNMSNPTHSVLQGFERSQQAEATGIVPLTPPTCCQLCPTNMTFEQECLQLAGCSGHGICEAGTCRCTPGWQGLKCEQAVGAKGSALAWVIVVAVVFTVLSLRVLFSPQASRYWRRRLGRRPESEDGDLEEALLPGDRPEVVFPDGEGLSDYSTESDSETSSTDGDGDGDEEGEEEGPAEGPVAGREAADDPSHGDWEDPEVGGTARAMAEASTAGASDLGPEAPRDPDANAAEPDKKASRRSPGGIQGTECIICMAKEVQVVNVPCGHACMCRKCARRCRRCPVCRELIVRRQKMYVTGS